MELSLEAYRLIINGITDRIDICALSRTSKGFQYAAERALYNTIYISNTSSALRLWESLSDQPRVSTLVEALTLSVPEDENGEVESLPTDYWNLLSRALARTTRLRHLNLHFNGIEDPPRAAILSHAAFRLRSFHCDFEWDHDLVKFLDAQVDLRDLYIADFKSLHTLDLSDTPGTSSTAIPPSDVPALPNLAILECTFTEAAVALVPGRPITHVKTCFSRTDMDEKRAEMSSLFSKIRLSSRNVHSIDIADSSYTESFSMEIISSVANMHPLAELRYIGTLVLPIDGQERLHFYRLLRLLPQLRSVELEVTEWDPAPTSRAALRALASELRIYCPSVTCVVFVYDFDRMIVRVHNGKCDIDSDASSESLWRDV